MARFCFVVSGGCRAAFADRPDYEAIDRLKLNFLNVLDAKVHLFEWAEWRRSRATYVPCLESKQQVLHYRSSSKGAYSEVAVLL